MLLHEDRDDRCEDEGDQGKHYHVRSEAAVILIKLICTMVVFAALQLLYIAISEENEWAVVSLVLMLIIWLFHFALFNTIKCNRLQLYYNLE